MPETQRKSKTRKREKHPTLHTLLVCCAFLATSCGFGAVLTRRRACPPTGLKRLYVCESVNQEKRVGLPVEPKLQAAIECSPELSRKKTELSHILH
mmetsp:Transcript_553/g.1307  ORF Transcript_553/g.1307 Transcript_553/m.1307 type:complete len:96 (+) Transcript_553:369-656(+)